MGVGESESDTETVDELMKQAAGAHTCILYGAGVGSLLRASSAQRSPYLLNNQEFHKAVIIVTVRE